MLLSNAGLMKQFDDYIGLELDSVKCALFESYRQIINTGSRIHWAVDI